MKTKTFLFLLAFWAVFSSCNSSPKKETGYTETTTLTDIDYSEMKEMAVCEETPPPPLKTTIQFTPPSIASADGIDERNVQTEQSREKAKSIEKKIIKDGDMSIETKDIAASKKGLDTLLKQFNAYYENESLENGDRITSYNLIIRIPANNFEKLIFGLENGKDKIENKNIRARDVTTEYIDLESRLNNKREYLKRYKELLSKALTVKDILEIEENIRNLQEEIESSEGRLKYLNDQIAYSTLNIRLFHEKEYVYQPNAQDNFWERVKKSLGNGWAAVVDFVLWIITIWPFILFVLIVIFVIRRAIKRRKRRKVQ